MSDSLLSIRSSPEVSKAGAEPGVREKEAAPPPEAVSSATSGATSDKTLLPFEERKKHLLWIWIPVVIGLGLLIAAGYVGGRIWTSKPQVSSEAPVAAQVAQTSAPTPSAPQISMPQTSSQPNSTLPSASDISPVAPAVGPAAASVSNAAPDDSLHSIPASSPAVIDPQDLDVITPQPGERYIQISALNTDAARKYVDELRHGPLAPHLAPGPRPNLLRVLIGPFKDTSSLLTTRSDLLAAGIDCFVREY